MNGNYKQSITEARRVDMKDKEAREAIKFIKDELKDIPITYIRDCPECNHPVLATRYGTLGGLEMFGFDYPYQCLSCGTKFTCSKECVSKLVEE